MGMRVYQTRHNDAASGVDCFFCRRQRRVVGQSLDSLNFARFYAEQAVWDDFK